MCIRNLSFIPFFRILLTGLFLLIFVRAFSEKTVNVSNLLPRLDTNGDIIDAHDGCVVTFGNRFYWYGTAYGDHSGFSRSNYYQCYSSNDLTNWKKETPLLKDAPSGVYYRPRVLYNSQTKKFVLWYNWNRRYGVAVSKSPTGPFTIIQTDVNVLNNKLGVGDFNLFKDDDGIAYIVYNTIDGRLSVERLTGDYLSSTLENGGDIAQGCEASVLFKRNGKYYVLTDLACCFCTQGSGARVYVSNKPMDGYVLHNNINRYAGRVASSLVDGFVNPNMFSILSRKNDGTFSSLEVELSKDTVLDAVKVIHFTGNRLCNCGDSTTNNATSPIDVPNFELYVEKDGIWIPVKTVNQTTKTSVYSIISLSFSPLSTRRVRITPASTALYSMMFINEVELYQGVQQIRYGLNAYINDIDQKDSSPIIPAQQTCVMPLETTKGIQYLWMGDLWGSASDNIKGHDYQYWSSPLQFTASGEIMTMKWENEWSIKIP